MANMNRISYHLNIVSAVILNLAEIIEMIYQLAGAGVSVTITLMGAIVSSVARFNLWPFTLNFKLLFFLFDETFTYLTLILEILDFAPTFGDWWPR